jgi:RNA polymerase sigma-70 factor (ECF subfamily)
VSTLFHPPNDLVDVRLLNSIKQGDEQSFGVLYARYYSSVFGFMFKIMHSRENAEDVVHDTFVKLWNMREKIDPDRNIKALIFVMARRAAIDVFRKSSRSSVTYTEQTNENTPATDSSPEKILEDIETKLLLDIAIESMPQKQREIFSLHYHENLSPAEIAQKTGLTYENVRKQIYNGKRQLRDVITAMIVFLYMNGQ